MIIAETNNFVVMYDVENNEYVVKHRPSGDTAIFVIPESHKCSCGGNCSCEK